MKNLCLKNLFAVPTEAQQPGAEEIFEPLISSEKGGLMVERIVSYGQVTPEELWLDQEQDEWVLILEGEAMLGYADGSEISLSKGDHVFLPKNIKHRVLHTSSPCLWLAVHGDSLTPIQESCCNLSY